MSSMASNRSELHAVLSARRISKEDFCAGRLAEYNMLADKAVGVVFCKKKPIARRATIANGKLDGTYIARYWNLELAPSSKVTPAAA